MKDFFANTWDMLLGIGAAAAGFMFPTGAPMVKLLLVMMVLDYGAALILAFQGKSPNSGKGGLCSKAGFRGLGKKLLILLAVAAAGVMDQATAQDAPIFQSAVALFYLSNEGISLLENLALAGVPIPKRLKNALEVILEKDTK